mmetsp:Transcript_12867/g.25391  ORF Transcript_12867/g.25391 Transcript_12867/m.25391 type:complete len:397 (+) Transcript_12867:78-1268(+)
MVKPMRIALFFAGLLHSASSIAVRLGTTMSISPPSPLNEGTSRRAVLGTVGSFFALGTAAQSAHADSGLAVVTDSDIGQLVRYGVIRGAQVADKADEFWERFSDKLRDNNACDEATGRRLFDNGFRSDGSRIGNPVLGSLCKPQPLKPLSPVLAQAMLDTAEEAAVKSLGQSRGVLSSRVDEVRSLIQPAFERVAGGLSGDERLRKDHNSKVFIQFKAYSQFATARNAGTSFDAAWGQELFRTLAKGNRGRADYTSPFPPPPDLEAGDDARPYDEGALLDALGALSFAFRRLEDGGLIGHWEISVPADDDGNVVTVAVDDDISLGAQFLLRERGDFTQQSTPLLGSAVQALVLAAIESAGIVFRQDSYFLDPSTTKQDIYEPTQLLLSMSNLRATK